MKVMVARDRGNGVQLELQDAPDPVVGPTEILVAVRATALNRVDLLATPYRFGHSPAESGTASGIEMAGEIVEMGEEVAGFRLNERVAAMAVASMAQLVKVDYRLALRLPPNLSWEAAAALPVGHLTAHDALTGNGAMQPGDAILVRGAASGVGIAALQIAKLKGASLVIGTSRSPEKRERLRALGFDHVFDDHRGMVADEVLSVTEGRGADLVLDMVGGPVFGDNVRAAALGGRIVSIGRLAGGRCTADLDLLAFRRLRLIGVTFRSRGIEEHATVVSRFAVDLMGEVEAGRLAPVIDQVLPFAEADAALARMRVNEHLGKIVLTL